MCVCVCRTLGNGLRFVRRLCVCIYTISFLRLCICVYSYICMCPCLSLSLSPCLPLAPCPPDSPTVLTLASTYATGLVQIWAREKMRDGINEGERGHRCQRKRMRVWILSCREHMGVALCSARPDEESRLEAKRAIVTLGEGGTREREWQVLAGAWLSRGGMAWCHSDWVYFNQSKPGYRASLTHATFFWGKSSF